MEIELKIRLKIPNKIRDINTILLRNSFLRKGTQDWQDDICRDFEENRAKKIK